MLRRIPYSLPGLPNDEVDHHHHYHHHSHHHEHNHQYHHLWQHLLSHHHLHYHHQLRCYHRHLHLYHICVATMIPAIVILIDIMLISRLALQRSRSLPSQSRDTMRISSPCLSSNEDWRNISGVTGRLENLQKIIWSGSMYTRLRGGLEDHSPYAPKILALPKLGWPPPPNPG